MENVTVKATNVKVIRFNPEQKKAQPPPQIVSSTISMDRPPMTPADLEKANLITKATRLKAALAEWARAGFPLATPAIRHARLAVCNACEYYDPKGNWGLGQCRAPGCACSRVKAALATQKCPKGKWKE